MTLFRHFGSKEALIKQAVSSTNEGVMLARLPEHPADPEQELLAWARMHYQFLFSIRSFIRIGMAEFVEHPEVTRAACQLSRADCQRSPRLPDTPAGRKAGRRRLESRAAASMLMGALFADAMGRDVMPARYPYSQRDAVGITSRCSCARSASRPRRRPSATAVRAPTIQPPSPSEDSRDTTCVTCIHED